MNPFEKAMKNPMKTKREDTKDKSKMACHECGALDHFVRDYTQVKKKVLNPLYFAFIGDQSFADFTDAPHLWVADFGSSDRRMWDRDGFVEYRHLPAVSRRLFMGNDSGAEVIGIGAFTLDSEDGSFVLLHDVYMHEDSVQPPLCVKANNFRLRHIS